MPAVSDSRPAVPGSFEHIDLALESVRARATEAGLDTKDFSALRALATWRQYLQADSPEQQEMVGKYLETMGFMPSKRSIISNALRSSGDRIDAFIERMLGEIASGKIDPEVFAATGTEELQREYRGLTKSQISLLKSMMQQQGRLDGLSIAEFSAQFPFQVNRGNFFGRFIAGGTDDPRKSIRYLRICTPFFVRTRSLLEGLSHDRRNFLVLDIKSKEFEDAQKRREQEQPDESGPLGPITKADNETVVNILHATINRVADFVRGSDGKINPDLQCIELPRLPPVLYDQVDPKQRAEFGVQFFNWLLYGDKSGELLKLRALSPSREEAYNHRKRELEKSREELTRHRKKMPNEKSRRAFKVWEGDEEHLRGRIHDLERDIRRDDAQRRAVKSVLRQLEQDDPALARVHAFREEVAAAQEAGKRIVFSSLEKQLDSSSHIVIYSLLDSVLHSKKYAGEASVRTLKHSSFVLTPEDKATIQRFRVSGFGSIMEQKVRNFRVEQDDFTPSLQYVVSNLLPERPDPQLSGVAQGLMQLLDIPGVHRAREFSYLVRSESGKRRPSAADYLTYAFEHVSHMNQRQLVGVLDLVREFGAEELPQRCIQLASERFGHRPAILEQFGVFNTAYRPEKIGNPPRIFEDVATFDRYLDLQLDAYGMQAEANTLEEQLCRHGVVAIVDGTNYHPEFVTEVEEQRIETSVEDTEEIWGKYVRPSERLIRTFALRLMEGQVAEELQNASLISVREPTKDDVVYAALIKKFFGLEVDLGPIPLPTAINKYTVLRGPHIDKKSREQFEMRTHKRLIDILDPTPQTVDALMKLELAAGVDVEIKL